MSLWCSSSSLLRHLSRVGRLKWLGRPSTDPGQTTSQSALVEARVGPPDIYPDPIRTPGAADPDITQNNVQENICNPNWSTRSIRPAIRTRRRQQRPGNDVLLEIRHQKLLDPAFGAVAPASNRARLRRSVARPDAEDLTADFVYMRLHGSEELYASGYSDEALDHSAARIKLWARGLAPNDARLIAPETPAPRRDARDVDGISTTTPRSAPRSTRALCEPNWQTTRSLFHLFFQEKNRMLNITSAPPSRFRRGDQCLREQSISASNHAIRQFDGRPLRPGRPVAIWPRLREPRPGLQEA